MSAFGWFSRRATSYKASGLANRHDQARQLTCCYLYGWVRSAGNMPIFSSKNNFYARVFCAILWQYWPNIRLCWSIISDAQLPVGIHLKTDSIARKNCSGGLNTGIIEISGITQYFYCGSHLSQIRFSRNSCPFEYGSSFWEPAGSTSIVGVEIQLLA